MVGVNREYPRVSGGLVSSRDVVDCNWRLVEVEREVARATGIVSNLCGDYLRESELLFVSGETGQEHGQKRAAPSRAAGVYAILAAVVGVMRDTQEVASVLTSAEHQGGNSDFLPTEQQNSLTQDLQICSTSRLWGIRSTYRELRCRNDARKIRGSPTGSRLLTKEQLQSFFSC